MHYVIVIVLTIFLCIFFFIVGRAQGKQDSVTKYFTSDSLHLIIPYADITEKRAAEIAKFIVVKKEIHERSKHDG